MVYYIECYYSCISISAPKNMICIYYIVKREHLFNAKYRGCTQHFNLSEFPANYIMLHRHLSFLFDLNMMHSLIGYLFTLIINIYVNRKLDELTHLLIV